MRNLERQSLPGTTRRHILLGSLSVAVAATAPAAVVADQQGATAAFSSNHGKGARTMGTVTTDDGVEIYYKDWSSGQPIVFHHGWPLSSDDWDTQMLFLVQHGYRVVGIDRRGRGRSSQVSDGHDMDHYAADVAVVVEHLDLRNTVHIGHSTGGGEAARYAVRHGQGRVAKLVLMSGVPPIMVKSPNNPDGLRSRCSTAFGKAWPPIVLSFIVR